MTITPSAYSQSLMAEMAYQKAATAILLATTRPLDRNPKGPMFSQTEIDEMDRARTMGFAPETFAAMLVARDKAGAQ